PRAAPPPARTDGRAARGRAGVDRADLRSRARPPVDASPGPRRGPGAGRARHRRHGGRRGHGRRLPPRADPRSGQRRGGAHAHAAAPQRAVLVTGATGAAAAKAGDYHRGPSHVRVSDGVARTPSGAIAGSALTMAGAVRHSVASGFTREQAVDAATRAPAAALGLTDVGEIRAGARADLVLFDDDLTVTSVLRGADFVPQV